MAGTFSQIYIQIVFPVINRSNLIQPEWEERLYQYITGIVKQKEQKMLAINGMPDHIHILIGMRPSCCLSDLVREIKKASNQFINDNKLSKIKFYWQDGFGAFSYGHSQLDSVIAYIRNQKQHHKKRSYRDEYIEFLDKFKIVYDERFLF